MLTNILGARYKLHKPRLLLYFRYLCALRIFPWLKKKFSLLLVPGKTIFFKKTSASATFALMAIPKFQYRRYRFDIFGHLPNTGWLNTLPSILPYLERQIMQCRDLLEYNVSLKMLPQLLPEKRNSYEPSSVLELPTSANDILYLYDTRYYL